MTANSGISIVIKSHLSIQTAAPELYSEKRTGMYRRRKIVIRMNCNFPSNWPLIFLKHTRLSELSTCRKTNVDRKELGIINEHEPISNKSDESEIAGEDTKTLQHGLLAEAGEANLSSNMQSNVA